MTTTTKTDKAPAPKGKTQPKSKAGVKAGARAKALTNKQSADARREKRIAAAVAKADGKADSPPPAPEMPAAPKPPKADIQADLRRSAMLVVFHGTCWQGRREDKKVNEEIARRYEAASGAGKYTKQLIAKEHLKGIKLVLANAREYHYRVTVPWTDNNRLLPVGLYEEYKTTMAAYESDLLASRQEFVEGYPAYIDEARERLGKMFSEKEYPPIQQITKRVTMDYVISPIPSAAHFVVDMAQDEAEKLQARIDENVESQIKTGIAHLHAEVHKLAQRFVAKLSPVAEGEKAQIFRDSMLESVKRLIDILPALNFAGDAILTKAHADISAALVDIDSADELRMRSKSYDPTKHDRVLTTMRDLDSRFSGYFAPPVAE